MADGTYLLLISPHERRGHLLARLNAPDMLSWFRDHWDGTGPDDALIPRVYGLGTLFDEVAEHGIACPEDDEELLSILESRIYTEGDIEVDEHLVHVETDDDEVDIVYLIFDQTFLDTPGALDRLPSVPEGDEDDDADEDDDVETLSYQALLASLD